MAPHDPKYRQVPQIVMLVAVAMLAAASGVASLARQVAELGPQVGDMVAFNPARPSPFDGTTHLTAVRPNRETCVLDMAVLQRSGGSLVVEERGAGPNRFYRLHWAGPRTSDDATNCGSDADLRLSQTDMNTIAMAASGFGADTPTMRLR
jgi:hypothetical protein